MVAFDAGLPPEFQIAEIENDRAQQRELKSRFNEASLSTGKPLSVWVADRPRLKAPHALG